MHDFFLSKINESIEEGLYFEATWLICSCPENRFFRVLDKYKRECKYCHKRGKCRKGSNQLALSSKVSCVERLCKENVSCISDSFPGKIFGEVRAWIKLRNRLMHNLLSSEHYEDDFDNDFKELALSGKIIVKDVFDACTQFREAFSSWIISSCFRNPVWRSVPVSRIQRRKSLDDFASILWKSWGASCEPNRI